MVIEPSLPETETLGQFLHRHRIEKGLDLAEVADETKIPQTTLKAMEEGDHKALPADAFARGFYSIYARLLELDVTYVLEHYAKERGASSRNTKTTLQTPTKLGEAVGPMAEHPMVSPISVMGFTLVLIILFITGICWYFSWNPAKFLSDQLRSLGTKPVIEQPKEKSTIPQTPPSPNEPTMQTAQPKAEAGNSTNETNETTPGTWKYTLLAEFEETTKVTVVVDEDFPEELSFSAGQSHEWHPKESMTLTLPAGTKARVTLNGVIIPLPAPVDGFITVSIPGSLPH